MPVGDSGETKSFNSAIKPYYGHPSLFIFFPIKNQVTISYEQYFRHIHQFTGFDGLKLSKKKKEKNQKPY